MEENQGIKNDDSVVSKNIATESPNKGMDSAFAIKTKDDNNTDSDTNSTGVNLSDEVKSEVDLNLESNAEASEEEKVFLEMAKAGVMYGHKKSRRNPLFEEYVFATRNKIEIIDLEQTLLHIHNVAIELKKYKNTGKHLLIVGTQPSARDAVNKLANAIDASYIVNKWIGGLITNFKIIYKRIKYLRERISDENENKFDDYTKKEQLMIHREIEKMSKKFEGLEEYDNVPNVVFIIDSSLKGHKTALNEAKRKGITTIGIIDNDDNPNDFDYFIPANDHSKSSINWVIDNIIKEIDSIPDLDTTDSEPINKENLEQK